MDMDGVHRWTQLDPAHNPDLGDPNVLGRGQSNGHQYVEEVMVCGTGLIGKLKFN